MTLDSTLTDYGFVCITGTDSMRTKSISYHSASNIYSLLQRWEEEKTVCMLYYRFFLSSFDALAHKLMLESLSSASVNCIISRYNPSWENLTEALKEDIEQQVCEKNIELVRRIREQDVMEQQVKKSGHIIPKELLTSEEVLYCRIQQLMEDKEILALSRLRRDDIAEILGTNGTYVADAIRICSSGLSVSEYINRKRVQHARFLFESHSESSIDEISELCGFSSRSRFHTAFKEYYNMTPGEFRKAIESKPEPNHSER